MATSSPHTTEAKTMAEAVGSIIRWPTHLLVQENAEFHNNDENVVEVQDASLVRDSWRKKRVQLWDEDGLQMLGEGVILLVHPYETINFTELDESHLGIILEKPLHNT